MDAPRSTLVIGYGNALRSDDGVGPRVAAAVAGWGRPGVEEWAVHQFTPELAEPLAAVELAIFIDARHAGDPRALLALVQAVSGRHPRAWWVTVPAPELGLGETRSGTAERGREAALQTIAARIGAGGG
ncbi:MAG TPA: hypothetical protein VF590_13580 [Isosphaeraceae bacterium]